MSSSCPWPFSFTPSICFNPVEDDDQSATREGEERRHPTQPVILSWKRDSVQSILHLRWGDRDRFLHLLHDIRNKKDAYVEQLSYLTLASLSAPTSRGDSSKQAILSSLFQGVEQGSDARTEQDRLALWQARLVLKIAEILDREEEELAWQLATIDDQEIALFRRLQGEIKKSGEGEIVEEDPSRNYWS